MSTVETSPAAGIASSLENDKPNRGMNEDTCRMEASTSWEGPAKNPSSANPGPYLMPALAGAPGREEMYADQRQQGAGIQAISSEPEHAPHLSVGIPVARLLLIR